MKTFFLQSLEKLLNQYLALDPESKTRLTRLANKRIKIELLAINLTMHLRIHDEQIYLEPFTEEADVIIRGTPLALFQVSWDKDNRKKFFAEDVIIEGNLELGQQIIDLFDELDIDWEEHLSRIMGDVSAHQIGRFARGVKSVSQRLRTSLLQNVNEYVHEEAMVFPPREELTDFFNDVDATRMEADRLEARVAQLKQRMANE